MLTAEQRNQNPLGEKAPYKPELFVGREKEIARFRWLLYRVLQSPNAGERIINFWGIEGSGKTWLLQHLAEVSADVVVQHNSQVVTAYSEFSPGSELTEETVAHFFAKQLLTDIIDQLSPVLKALQEKENQSFEEIKLIEVIENLQFLLSEGLLDSKEMTFDTLMQWLINSSALLSKAGIPTVLLVDNYDTLRPELQAVIEREVFEEIMTIVGRSVLVVAGREQVGRWRRFEVRNQVQDYFAPHETMLQPFSEGETHQQTINFADAEQFSYAIFRDYLHALSGGNPAIAEKLLREFTPALFDEMLTFGEPVKTRTTEQEEMYEFLSAVYDQQVDAIRESGLLESFEEIAVLRSGRLEDVKEMHTKAGHEPTTELDSLKVLRSLDQATNFVYWDTEERTYILSFTIRKLYKAVLEFRDPQKLVQQHQMAFEMYLERLTAHPMLQEAFIGEVIYQALCIYRLDLDQEQLEGRFSAIIEMFVNRGGAAYVELIDEFVANGHSYLDGDSEIISMFSLECTQEFNKLLKKAEGLSEYYKEFNSRLARALLATLN